MKNRSVILHSYPQGNPCSENFIIRETKIPEPAPGELLVKARFFSVDPYMRGRMSGVRTYIDPYKLKEVISGDAIAEVVQSNSNDFQSGDIVTGKCIRNGISGCAWIDRIYCLFWFAGLFINQHPG